MIKQIIAGLKLSVIAIFWKRKFKFENRTVSRINVAPIRAPTTVPTKLCVFGSIPCLENDLNFLPVISLAIFKGRSQTYRNCEVSSNNPSAHAIKARRDFASLSAIAT